MIPNKKLIFFAAYLIHSYRTPSYGNIYQNKMF
nr:MAG TPA: hypothetical protein [Caudoviricetes sp.]